MRPYFVAVTQKRPDKTIKTEAVNATGTAAEETLYTEPQDDEVMFGPEMVMAQDDTAAYNAGLAKAAIKPGFNPSKARVWYCALAPLTVKP